jgi:flagellar hook-length control protein FliK
MTPDTMRIEAGLIARNQAQAAQSRSAAEGFSSALEQASRSQSEEPRTEPPPKTQAEPGRKTDPAELKRLLQQIQKSTTSPQARSAADQPGLTSEPQAALAAQEEGSTRAKLRPQARTPEDALASQAESRQPAQLPLAQTPTAAAPARGGQPTRELPQSDDDGTPGQANRSPGHPTMQGLHAGSSRPGAGAAEAPSGASAVSQSRAAAGISASKSGAAGMQGQGLDAVGAFSASLARVQESTLPTETSLQAAPENLTPGLAGITDAAGSGGAAASLLAGAFQGGQAAGLSNPAAAGQAFQAGPVSWTLTYAPGDARFGDALGERLSWMVRDGLQQAEITLNPQELGPIRIALTMAGDAAELSIQAEHALTRQSIEEALPRLKALLADQGLQLGQTDVGQSFGRDPESSGRQAQRQDTSRGRAADSGSGNSALAEGRVQTGQALVRPPGSGRIDVFA